MCRAPSSCRPRPLPGWIRSVWRHLLKGLQTAKEQGEPSLGAQLPHGGMVVGGHVLPAWYQALRWPAPRDESAAGSHWARQEGEGQAAMPLGEPWGWDASWLLGASKEDPGQATSTQAGSLQEGVCQAQATLASHCPRASVCFAGINGKTLLSALGRHTPEPKSCHSNTAEPQPASLTPASIPNASPSWSRSSSQKSTTGTPSAHNSSGSSKISSGSLLSPQSPGELAGPPRGTPAVTSPPRFPKPQSHILLVGSLAW